MMTLKTTYVFGKRHGWGSLFTLFLLNGLFLSGCVEDISVPAPTPSSSQSMEDVNEGGDLNPQEDLSQSMGGQNMGGQNMGGQNTGGQNTGGQNTGGQNMGGQDMGGQNMGGQNMGGQDMGGQNMGGQDQPSPQECAPLPRRLRRLSHEEYAYTLSDLFGIEISEIGSLVADPKRGGFTQDPHLLFVSPLLVENYQQIAESLSERLINEEHPFVQFDCEDSETEGVCVYRWILRFGDQVYRRPLTMNEADRFIALYTQLREQECQDKALQWVVTAFLQSPHFLYRTELGQVNLDTLLFELNPYEKANLLSYSLWQSMPDSVLFQKAYNGQLNTEEELENEIQRLMEDPKHVRVLSSFLDQWLGLKQILNVTRDPIVYQALYFEIREMMLNETFLFFRDLWNQERTFSALFTQNLSWLNDELALYYQAEEAWEEASLDQEVFSLFDPSQVSETYKLTEMPTQRQGGILTHGSLLTIYAHPTSSSPIHRGLFVRDRLLCEALPPPPEGVDLNVGAPQEGEDTRSHFEAHSSEEACQGCHTYIDPLGFTFESFDGIGRFRTEDQGHPVDTEGFVLQIDQSQVPLNGVQDLSSFLSESSQAERCYVRQWMRFIQGEADEIESFGYENEALKCQIDSIQSQSSSSSSSSTLKAPLIASLSRNFRESRQGTSDDLPTDFEAESRTPLSIDARLNTTEADLSLSNALDSCREDPSGPINDMNVYALSPGLTFEFREDRWQSGMCGYYTLFNPTDSPIEWSMTFRIEGTLNNSWNIQIDEQEPDRIVASGVNWNRQIPAQGGIDFGFCTSW